jgi:hypothetical protein
MNNTLTQTKTTSQKAASPRRQKSGSSAARGGGTRMAEESKVGAESEATAHPVPGPAENNAADEQAIITADQVEATMQTLADADHVAVEAAQAKATGQLSPDQPPSGQAVTVQPEQPPPPAEAAGKPKSKAARKEAAGEAGKPADDVLGSYPNLGGWPANAGPVPSSKRILTARALGMGAGTKRELAVAAYLRDEANGFALSNVAEAVRAVLGGEYNVQRNVATGLEAAGLAKINKVMVEGAGTSFRLELTAKGEAKVETWLAEHGRADA